MRIGIDLGGTKIEGVALGDGGRDLFDDVIELLLAKGDSPWRRLPWTEPLGTHPALPPAGAGAGPVWTLE